MKLEINKFILIVSSILLLSSCSQGSLNNRIWTEGKSSDLFSCDSSCFSGFSYDLDNNIGTESLNVKVIKQKNRYDRKIAEGNLIYSTRYEEVGFRFKEWGNYYALDFLGDNYLAGYSYNSSISENDTNFLARNCLGEILKNENIAYTIDKNLPLNLEENYSIELNNINDSQDQVIIRLLKNGYIQDQKTLNFNEASNITCIFTHYFDGENAPFIILHMTSPLGDDSLTSITIDAVFQISDQLVSLRDDFQLTKNIEITSSKNRITLMNKNSIKLNKGSVIPLFRNIGLKVADSDKLEFMPVQIKPIMYRSVPITPSQNIIYILNPSNFEGFYYDIDHNLGKEQMSFSISEGNLLLGPDGIIYSTSTQRKRFNFSDWGYFNIIGFLGEEYFAGYAFDENINPRDQILCNESVDENSLSKEQLQRILIDNDRNITISSVVHLEEGYELRIRSIDEKENKAFVELYKDGHLEDTKVISPSIENANMSEKTYYYRKTIGNQKDLVIISVHFIKAFRGIDSNQAIIDGIWQISDDAIDVRANTNYGNMRIAGVTEEEITMDNKDNIIKLDKDKNIDLMGGISIETADADELRFIIIREKNSS
jgi:S-layer protein (TIGR01567 family)